ncbi:MAG: hypothetical protein JXB26_00770 [Candidatus Aminicenantes bacterium]|nr:hypothetical protein [Candidatus Aminicenantes bacterium]
MPRKKLYAVILPGFFIGLVCLVCCKNFSHSQKNYTELGFWTVGDGINERFGTNIHQTLDKLRGNTSQLDEFLLTIADQPFTKTQILERSGLTPSQVDYLITNLVSFRLIKKDNQGRWATVLPVITDNQMKTIREDLETMAENVARHLQKEIHQMITLYNRVKSPPDPPWEDINHLFVDKFIIDGTFHRSINNLRLEQKSEIREPDEKQQTTSEAFFFEYGKNFSTFGTNWYAYNEGGDQRDVYVLHGALFDRYDIAMNKYRGDEHFAAVLFNITPEGGIHSLTHQEKVMLQDMDWISNDRLLVPIVKAETIKRLWQAIEEMGKDAAEVAFSHFTDITDSYKKAPHSKFLDSDEDYIQVCIHVLFGLIIEHLEKNGVVSPIPHPAPESFGVYVVFGKLF